VEINYFAKGIIDSNRLQRQLPVCFFTAVPPFKKHTGGFFLECLRCLKDTKALIKTVSHLYGQIDLWITHENADSIR
jgi:hypothetical protein